MKNKHAHLTSEIVTEPTGTTTGDTNWLNIVQDDIDPRFDNVTKEFVNRLFAQVAIGEDPYSVLVSKCPVQRRVVPDGVIASYTASVIVNRSESLKGGYTLEAGEYEVRGPYSTTRNKSGSFLTDEKIVIELGWLPDTISVTQDYGPQPPIQYTQSNGYLYLDQAAKALLWIKGVADVDRWEIIVEHKQGESFNDSSIPVVARWGAENEVDGEVLIPGCVKDAFNECPRDGYGVGGPDPLGRKWRDAGDFDLNPTPPRTIYYEGCTGKFVEERVEDE